MQNPKVSILIPFKDTAHFLPECLDSILAQTYPNWEVLSVNDHSTDTSLELLNSYAQKDSRIKVFNNSGNGIIPALRAAYAESSGELVTRMDSDDIMKPHRLEVMVQSLLKSGKGHAAVGQVKYFSDRGISNGYERYETWLNQLTATGSNYSEIYKECVIPSPCWMVYREDFETCGAFRPNRYPEDYDLTFRFYEKNLKIIPCKEVLHLWRDYDTRTSRNHEHYAQNYFLDIKLHYFLKLDHNAERPLVIWGAGFKGKSIAKNLLKQKVDFTWLCDNPKKIGKKIYGKELVHFKFLERLNTPQSIVTVANETAQKEIKGYFSKFGHLPMKDYFFFC
jgi:glycosyltransferase involved in cell wall biosynthesis